MASAIFKERQPSPSWLIVLTVACLVVASCKKASDYNAITSTDKTKPGVISNIKVASFNGGAYITYTLPDSKNILYVQANYQINSKTSRQTKSSYYSDSITVSGFADTIDYKVVLYTVSRAEVRSISRSMSCVRAEKSAPRSCASGPTVRFLLFTSPPELSAMVLRAWVAIAERSSKRFSPRTRVSSRGIAMDPRHGVVGTCWA